MSERPITVMTADEVEVKAGEPLFDYYSMKAGQIVEGTINTSGGSFDGWFDFRHDDTGRTILLNGERICTQAHARQMGWL